MKDDKQLQRDVLDELQWEPSVDAAEIGVTARDGVVMLTGMVPTFTEKVNAERAVKRVLGVRGLANDLEVRTPHFGERTDADIARTVIDALQGHAGIPADRLKVTVDKGWVALDGEVDWHYQKVAAEETARPILGVRGVFNEITIASKPLASDVKDRIEAAFRRSAEVDAKKIHVETNGNKVTLKGGVRTWGERQAALWTAWSAPGVSQVEDQLTIAP